MINVDYPELLKLFPQHLAPKRSESASFLIWYLENYYRLDTLDAIDSVCDQRGDKGVDGIFVNDSDQTITIFQSKISQSSNSSIGDSGLRELMGTVRQFENIEAIQNLITTGGIAEVAKLAKNLDLISKVATHELRAEFVSNVNLDTNGQSYLNTIPNLTVVGKDRKYEVFEDHYAAIFGRPGVTADRIVLCETIKEEVDAALPKITNELLSKYVLTRYAILYIIRSVLESDQMAMEIIQSPAKFVRKKEDRDHFKACIARIVKDLIIDLNEEVKELGADFDYRGKLREADWVKRLGRTVVGDHKKLVERGRIPSFKEDWENKGKNLQGSGA